MGDRGPSFFRFWTSTSNRRKRAAQTAAPPPPPPPTIATPAPTTTTTAEEPQKVGQPIANSSASPSPPPQPTATTAITNSTVEPQKPSSSSSSSSSSPATATPSPSSSKPASPSRRTPQSRSPPQGQSTPSSPSPSPSRKASPTPSTPQRAPQPHSPARSPKQTSSGSPKGKGVQPNSPSKQPRSTTSASVEKGPKPTPSQQESQQNADVKSSDGADAFNGEKPVVETSFKRDEVEVKSAKSSEIGTTTTIEETRPTQKVESPTINTEHMPLQERNEKPKEIKEVVQETKSEPNGETKKKTNEVITPKPDRIHAEKQDALKANTPFQSKKRSTISDTHNQSAGKHVLLHKDIRADVSSFVNRMAIGDPNTATYDRPVSVITIAGENRGATMQVGSNSSNTEWPIHIHRGYKINPDESAEAATDGDGISEGKNSEDAMAREDQPEAYVNNNAQGINNSLVFNSSISERNPGVHITMAHFPTEQPQSTDKTSLMEPRKAEFNVARSEKLTYEPRRRCLRGLFLETSDSDTENPDKPRRHGCRVGCQLKDNENNIDVL